MCTRKSRDYRRRALYFALALLGAAVAAHAESVTFTPRSLFQVQFGNEREALGSHVEGDNFLFPRDFTMDASGRFYIYDATKHRIARFSSEGKYEAGFLYPATARQVFAHADSSENLWLLVSDPHQGMYYGVSDSRGKSLRSGIFSKFNQFRLHLDDESTLHVILSSDKNPEPAQTYLLDEESLLMKKESIAPPPETHHRVRKSDRVYYVDQAPGASPGEDNHVNRITDASHRSIADIQGRVIYMTGRGEVYTRVGKREIRVYDIDGSLKGKVTLKGLSSACESVRFDSYGNIYQLDGIPDQTDEQVRRRDAQKDPRTDFEDLHYTSGMPGMRLIQWERR